MRTLPAFPAAAISIALAWLVPGLAGAAAPRGGKEGEAERFKREAGMRIRADEAVARERQGLREAWLRALRLDEREDECVAFDPARSACLVTVAAFNSRADAWPKHDAPAVPESLLADQARLRRRDILGSMLAEPYLEYRMESDPARDSLESAWRGRLEEKPAGNVPADSALRTLYRARFESDFKARREAVLQVLAMSDSALADSLAAAFRSLGAAAVDAWRWRTPDTADLPSGLRERAGGLSRGETAGPFKASYGWLFLRCASLRHHPAVAFEDAIPALMVLAQAPGTAQLPSDSSVAAYYREHAWEFAAPDTVRLGMSLTPNRSAGAGADPALSEIAVDDAALPRSLGPRLRRFLPGNLGDTLGPVQSAFGSWRFRILGPARSGRLPTFAEARPSILERLGKTLAEPPAGFAEKARRDRLAWAAMAGAYLDHRPAADGGPARSLASSRAEWMRERLAIRFIDPG